MAKFEIGQRVRLKASCVHHGIVGQQDGHVVELHNRGHVGVEFDKRFVGGHDCAEQGKDGHCWYVSPHDLEALTEPESGEPGTTFKIGDWVTVITDTAFLGDTGTIDRIEDGVYRIVFPDEAWFWATDDSIRLATSDEIEDAYDQDDSEDRDDPDTRIEISVTVKIPPSVLMDLLR